MVHATKFTLHAEKVGVFSKINSLPKDVEFDFVLNNEVEGMLLRLTKFVYYSGTKTIEIQKPINWWQHLKHDLFPEWLKDRFPVVYSKIHIDVKEHFPDLSFLSNNRARYLTVRNYE